VNKPFDVLRSRITDVLYTNAFDANWHIKKGTILNSSYTAKVGTRSICIG